MSGDKRHYLKFEHNGIQSAEFSDLRIEKTDGIPSDSKSMLILMLNMKNGAYVWEEEDGSSKMLHTVDEVFLLNRAECRLRLKTEGSGKSMEISLRSQDTRVYKGGYVKFSKTISPVDAEFLSSWRQGETVNVSWSVDGYALLGSTNIGTSALHFNMTNESDGKKQPSIAPRDFIQKLIQPMGLSNRMIVELPVEVPGILNSATTLPPGISALKPHLGTLLRHLQAAIGQMRNAGTAADFRSVMSEIRTPLDSILNFQSKSDLAKELFIDTGIIRDVDPGAALEASEEIIEDIWESFRNLHDIDSKPLHTTTKTRKNKLSFTMSPEKADAEYVLTEALAKAKYLNTRIEAALVRR